jgi:hypothetical protein
MTGRRLDTVPQPRDTVGLSLFDDRQSDLASRLTALQLAFRTLTRDTLFTFPKSFTASIPPPPLLLSSLVWYRIPIIRFPSYDVTHSRWVLCLFARPIRFLCRRTSHIRFPFRTMLVPSGGF